MYEPGTETVWVPTNSGGIPDQAVIYGKGTDAEAVYVARVEDSGSMGIGSFETKNACAEYLKYRDESETSCSPTFEFRVQKQEGKLTRSTNCDFWNWWGCTLSQSIGLVLRVCCSGVECHHIAFFLDIRLYSVFSVDDLQFVLDAEHGFYCYMKESFISIFYNDLYLIFIDYSSMISWSVLDETIDMAV